MILKQRVERVYLLFFICRRRYFRVRSHKQTIVGIKCRVKHRVKDTTLCFAFALPPSFTFYLHNTVYNPAVDNKDNFNSIYGLPPNISFPNPYTFGVMNTFEDPITSGPSNTSAPLGKAQGFYLLNSFNEYTLFHVFTANITEGDYKGTIAIFGQVREVDPVRYLTVIGGTGAFPGARGLAKNRLIDIDHAPPAKWTMSFELDLYY
ncbi:hypothetical protein KP509_38G029800 [Ceratopteris richardii]|uniref:Dirigent protein n=1 Tax=Ceratopteris richardii TaxID=49495 RepID=A0A8T2Q3N4_CERRI|nr:hypothetical protein KP509_38G029800 [Ceratopteris richardii]